MADKNIKDKKKEQPKQEVKPKKGKTMGDPVCELN